MSKLRTNQQLRSHYMAYINDGIIDLFVGLMLIFAGLVMFADMFWMAGAYVAIFLPVVWSIKESITVPRLAAEEIGQEKVKETRSLWFGLFIGLSLLLVLGVTVFLLFDNANALSISRDIIMALAAGLVALVILAVFVVVGTIYRSPRWYAYTGGILLIALLGWILQISLPWILMAIGAMMALTGLFYLLRFLRSHPVLPDSERLLE